MSPLSNSLIGNSSVPWPGASNQPDNSTIPVVFGVLAALMGLVTIWQGHKFLKTKGAYLENWYLATRMSNILLLARLWTDVLSIASCNRDIELVRAPTIASPTSSHASTPTLSVTSTVPTPTALG